MTFYDLSSRVSRSASDDDEGPSFLPLVVATEALLKGPSPVLCTAFGMTASAAMTDKDAYRRIDAVPFMAA